MHCERQQVRLQKRHFDFGVGRARLSERAAPKQCHVHQLAISLRTEPSNNLNIYSAPGGAHGVTRPTFEPIDHRPA